ncbi:MAG TPA: dienelactone hydrolase family protein [Candidatus Sulfotelmatobacter sp.]|nr:dienelactone hydrolase family protein [Candidatus Sulfotelmatobacter sp.]
MIAEHVTISGPAGPMDAYLARLDAKPRPAVIVLEGVYGFDAEIRRITAQVAAAGYVGLAIDYLRGRPVEEVFDDAAVGADVGAARDWLDEQSFVRRGHIGAWGFGWGGTAAFVASSQPGIGAAIAFYGQSIARPLGKMTRAPLDAVEHVRAPLLLIFGGHDELIPETEIALIRERLTAQHKTFELETYPDVGHSFFREDLGTLATRQISDAWDRVQSFLRRHLT